MKFEVEFYETKNEIQPAREFILSQEKKFLAKTLDMNNFYKTTDTNYVNLIQKL